MSRQPALKHLLAIYTVYSPDMDPRGKEKERPAKNNLAEHSVENERSKAGSQSWREVCTAVQGRNRWRAHVEALCANLALGDR